MALRQRTAALPSLMRALFLRRAFCQISDNDPEDKIRHIFQDWCKENSKSYPSEEERLYRFDVFKNSYKIVTEHNAKGDSSFTMGLTPFADLTNFEFGHTYMKRRVRPLPMVAWNTPNSDSIDGKPVVGGYLHSIRWMRYRDVPASVDWRKLGAVTRVRHQGNHGSWAFAAVGAVEGMHKIVTGTLVALSEQELLDCHCSHRSVDAAFDYIIKSGGLCKEVDYVYQGRVGRCMRHEFKKHYVPIDGYVFVTPGDEEELKQAVACQPVCAGIYNAKIDSFQYYTGGILMAPVLEKDVVYEIDHHVLIVGYGSREGIDYWIIKNSWGTRWGIDGYLLLQRSTGDFGGVFGVNVCGCYPTIEGLD